MHGIMSLKFACLFFFFLGKWLRNNAARKIIDYLREPKISKSYAGWLCARKCDVNCYVKMCFFCVGGISVVNFGWSGVGVRDEE